MRKVILILAMVLIASGAQAAGVGFMEQDKTTNVVQGPAPNGTLSLMLTVNSLTIDAAESLWYTVYAPGACKIRLTPTVAKGAYPQFTAPAAVWTQRYVNKATPFIHISSCASGELQRQ